MKLDPNKLFPGDSVVRDGVAYLSQIFLPHEMMPEVLDALEDFGVVWATGIKLDQFDPRAEEPDSRFFMLELFNHMPTDSVRVCYGDYEEYPTVNHDFNQFWFDEVLMDQPIEANPLDLSALFGEEVSV